MVPGTAPTADPAQGEEQQSTSKTAEDQTMKDAFEFADELGPLKTIHIHEPSTGLRAVLVVDNVAKGPSIGGVRMAPDVSTRECFRLARAMTLKNAAAGLPHGGGKAVLYGDPKMQKADKERLIRALANALRYTEDYIFAPDMGTDEECMSWIQDEIGRVVALPREIGGIPLDEIGATGWGLSHVRCCTGILRLRSEQRAHRGAGLRGGWNEHGPVSDGQGCCAGRCRRLPRCHP